MKLKSTSIKSRQNLLYQKLLKSESGGKKKGVKGEK